MDRRFLTVLGVSLVFALVVSGIFYQMTARAGSPAKRVERTDQRDVVVAARPLGIGVTVKPGDVKIVKIPLEQAPKNGFSKVEEVLDRPIVSNILQDEPVLEGRLATRGSGLGLAPIIPVGMRAVTVRVNEMVGVAGFVLPGLRVDVLVTGKPPEASAMMTSTVLQNILVLSAGQTIQPDQRGNAINAPTVTLLVSPDQAETLTLAGNEGRIQLVLRNGSDQNIEKTAGRDLGELFGHRASSRKQTAGNGVEGTDMPARRVVHAAPAPPPVAMPVLPPPPVAVPPPPPPPDEIITFRGTVKAIETVAPRKN